jgi:hypothetical protein
VASGLCDAHAVGDDTAQIGASCVGDADCASNMRCEYERQRCTGGDCVVYQRNGYCVVEGCVAAASLPIRSCPSGSTCNRSYPGGLCQKTCDLAVATDCRNNNADQYGDYECRDWSRVIVDGTDIPLSDAPVCDFGTRHSCADVDCALLGASGNPTSMSCRTLDGQPTTDPRSPTGYCLDNTASGS